MIIKLYTDRLALTVSLRRHNAIARIYRNYKNYVMSDCHKFSFSTPHKICFVCGLIYKSCMQANFATHKTSRSFKLSTEELGDPRILIKIY